MIGRAIVAIAFANLTSAVATLDQAALPAFDVRTKLAPYSFDVSEGHYSSTNLPIDCHVNAIRLQGRFTKLGTASTEWFPMLSLTLDSEQKGAVIRLTTFDYHPPISVEVEEFDRKVPHEEEESVTLYQTFDLKTPVPILASWSPEGLVTFNVAGETRIVNLGGPVRQATLSGSTATGTFDPVETGVLEGTAPDMLCPKKLSAPQPGGEGTPQ
jgi:hypothetical protein